MSATGCYRIITRLVRPLFAFVVAALVAGCATRQSLTLPDLPDWETRKAVLENVDEWEFSGRIGVKAGNEGFNGQLWWRQDGVVFRARVGGPLGVGTIFINGDHREMTLTDKDGVVTELADAEIDLREMYGWTIPVTSLRYWALGIPDPAAEAATELDEAGLLTRLEQHRWQVDISQYRDAGGQPMPRRLTALSDDARVRLVIDNWVFR